ncbi:hypothetical protein PMI03_05476 [Rhizobium sp. AP16]|nr:hypothetical protein PMI03_05476 [Rhizobium sp. AP16]
MRQLVGGEGGSYGAANYQYNYLTHEQAKELTDAEKASEACKVSPTTCSDAYKAQLQSQVDGLKSLDYQTTMSLLQACLDQGAYTCTTEQNKWLAAYKTWRDADSAADRNDPNYEQMLENYRNLAAAGLVAKELGKTQEYGEVYQMTKGFELGAVSGAVAALGTISLIAGQEAVSTVVAVCGRSSAYYATYLNMALHDVVATTAEFGGSPTAATLLGTALAEARVAVTNGTVTNTGLVLFNKSTAGDALNDPALLKRIADAVSRQGKTLEIGETGSDLYNYYKALGAQGSTMMLEDGKISIGISADAGPSALFEELVHYGQYRSGQVDLWTAQYG